MRTNIVLNEALISEAMRVTGIRTKREMVDLALRELLARRLQREILDLQGEGLIAADYDVRAVRAGMVHGSG